MICFKYKQTKQRKRREVIYCVWRSGYTLSSCGVQITYCLPCTRTIYPPLLRGYGHIEERLVPVLRNGGWAGTYPFVQASEMFSNRSFWRSSFLRETLQFPQTTHWQSPSGKKPPVFPNGCGRSHEILLPRSAVCRVPPQGLSFCHALYNTHPLLYHSAKL